MLLVGEEGYAVEIATPDASRALRLHTFFAQRASCRGEEYDRFVNCERDLERAAVSLERRHPMDILSSEDKL